MVTRETTAVGLQDPAERVVMISGASRGIGRAIAVRLQHEDYQLSLGMREPGRSGWSGPQVLTHRFDALQPATAESWVEATVARYGRIDVLINCAGVLRPFDFDTMDEGPLDESWEVNVKAPLRMIRHALPYLKKSGSGRIVNIASTDGKRYRDASVSVAYAMTKHALVALSHAAKFAGWADGVRVTALCPGAVDTELIAQVAGVTSPANRMSPAVLAEVVAFLLRLPNTASVAEMFVNTRLEPSY